MLSNHMELSVTLAGRGMGAAAACAPAGRAWKPFGTEASVRPAYQAQLVITDVDATAVRPWRPPL